MQGSSFRAAFIFHIIIRPCARGGLNSTRSTPAPEPLCSARRRRIQKDIYLTDFTSFGLAEPLLRALTAKGYEKPTPIQVQAIPPAMEGHDILGVAQTGTGKTAAFALPILHRLFSGERRYAPRRGCRVLVLSPTRELASQIAENFAIYGKGYRANVAVIFGGAKMSPQIRTLAPGVDILVATPGRLIDHLGQGTVSLKETEILVLDEADQMLDLGFFRPIRQIVAYMPKQRQSLFFSATMPEEIGKLADELLNKPVKVSVAPAATTVEKVAQKVIFVEAGRKRPLLAEMFADPAFDKVIVFTRTKHGADRVAEYLEKAGIQAAAIHGDKRQGQREKALADFKKGHVRALVATDIASRGIDVDAVSHVVNYEMPMTPEAYVHRIGRTARAGAGGDAISLCADDERLLLRAIQKATRQTLPAEDRRANPGTKEYAEASPPEGKKKPNRRRPLKSKEGGEGASAPSENRHRRPAPNGKPGGNKSPAKVWDPMAAERPTAPRRRQGV